MSDTKTLHLPFRAMGNPEMTNEERVVLLRKACSEHQQLYRDAMNGKGIDRHMFGLYVACKGLGYVRTPLLL